MAHDFWYGAPDVLATGQGPQVEVDRARINLLWLVCAAVESDAEALAYCIPGCTTIINGTMPEWTSIECAWTYPGDILAFRLTPTWTAGEITDMLYEMDVGAGYEALTGPQGAIPTPQAPPRYQSGRPNPLAPDVELEMDAFRDNMLAAMVSAGFGGIGDSVNAFVARLPGFTASAAALTDLIDSIELDDNTGPPFPKFRYEIARNAVDGRPNALTVWAQRTAAQPEFLMHRHNIIQAGDGFMKEHRVASEDITQ